MKKLFLISCMILALVTAVAPMAMAAYEAATVGGFGPYQAANGGEFTLLPNQALSNLVYSNYATGAKDFVVNGTFQTFCVESGESIFPNTNYFVTINDKTVAGGKPLTMGTAWLYHEFQNGTLGVGTNAAYAYTGDTNQRKASAELLQKALWYEMGITGGQTNIYTTLAEGQGFTASDPNNGFFDVKIANLWASYNPRTGVFSGGRQDVLVCTPVPEPMTLLFLGGCLLGTGIISRKFFKA
jgi:hypothetical protein